MDITITRKIYSDKSTIGKLSVPAAGVGTWEQTGYDCFTLEDKVRLIKIFGSSAIPAGKYLIQIRYSPKMKRYRILLEKVPLFTWIYQHRGNRPEDTEGCILVGEAHGTDEIYNSAGADNNIWERVMTCILKNPHDPIYFNITDK